MAERQRRGRLDRLDREVAANVADPGQAQQGLAEQAFVGAQVGDHHLQEEVRLAGDEVHRDHLRQVDHRTVEGLGLLLAVAFHLDPDEHREAEADLVAVDAGLVAANHPGLFQQAHAAQAGGRGEADLLGQLDVAQAAVALEGGEDAVVIGVEFHLGISGWIVSREWNLLPNRMDRLVENASTCPALRA